MAWYEGHLVRDADDLIAVDAAIDRSICGRSLARDRATRLAAQGAHDPTPTPYWVLRELFAQVELDDSSSLLDVGCGAGRVLAFLLRTGFMGSTTGVELDAEYARIAQGWTSGHKRLRIVQGNALDQDLGAFSHFYLFNPFDPEVLDAFIRHVEEQVPRPVTVMHMSDNGNTIQYLGRPGWSELSSGRIQDHVDPRGERIPFYDCPQHFTIWRFVPRRG